MTEHIVETTTIVGENGNTIIIAHPPVKKELDYWEVVTGWYETIKSAFQHVNETSTTTPVIVQEKIDEKSVIQETIVADVSPPIILEIQKPLQEIKEPEQSQPSKIWNYLSNTFSRQNLSLYRKQINQKIAQFDGFDDRLSKDITNFKRQNVFALGDVRVRSILLGFSSALLYKIISSNTKGLFKKTRNFAGSFIFMGYWLVPELFNPFLRRSDIAQRVI